MSIRVIVAEDSALLRHGLVRLLETVADIDVVATCDDYDSLLAAVDACIPDAVVTDIRMPPGHDDEGIRAAAALRLTHPGIGVVVLSQHASPAYALRLLEDGAAGRAYLLKDRVREVAELTDAIRTVTAGGSVVDAAVVDLLVAARRGPDSTLDWLTDRERDVLRLMAEGKSNAAIARQLAVSVRAVEKYSNGVFVKLGISEEPDANRRVRAVLVYLGTAGASG